VFGILRGVILAAIASILLMIKTISDPYVAFLGRIPGTKRYTDISRHQDNEIIPGLLLIRVESSLLYFNVENVRKKIRAAILESGTSLKCVIWDFSSSPYVDIAGAKLIKSLYLDLKAKGIKLKIAEPLSRVRDILRAEELEELMGHISRKISLEELVDESAT